MTREEILEYFKDINLAYNDCTRFDTLKRMLDELEQEQRTGHWIAQEIHNCHTDFKCSECGYIHNFLHLYGEPTADYTYCPNCGAKMASPTGAESEGD